MDQLSELSFDSQEDMMNYLQSCARAMGFALVKKRSKAGKQVLLQCDRGGKYVFRPVIPGHAQRQTSTRRINCPYEVYGSLRSGAWRAVLKNGEHNHDASEAAAHPAHRKLDETSRELVHALSTAGAPPATALLTLKQRNPENVTIAKDISNETARWRRASLNGLSPLQALLRDADTSDWITAYRQSNAESANAAGQLQGLFLMHRHSQVLTKTYHHVVAMDSTYRTTRTKMPLLHVVGMTATNRTFTVALVYLLKETREFFIWALEQLKEHLQEWPRVVVTDRDAGLIAAVHHVFPAATHLLCFWHIEMNVLSHGKRAYGRDVDAFNDFMQQWKRFQAEQDYDRAMEIWNRLAGVLAVQQPDLLNYLNRVWLPERAKFMHAETKFYAHFGNTTSSRVESGHAYLKRFIRIGTGDIRTAWQAIGRALQRQLEEVTARLSYERINSITALNGTPMRSIAGIISHHASGLVLETYRKAQARAQSASEDNASNQTCGCMLHLHMGLPCVHQLQRLISTGGQLHPDDIHAQWWLVQSPSGSNFVVNPPLVQQMSDLLNHFKDRFSTIPSSMQQHALQQVQEVYSNMAAGPQEPILPVRSRGRPRTRPTRTQAPPHPSIAREPSLFEYN